MACGCLPVGTLNTSLPEVIGDAGYLVPFGDIPATVNAIRSAMTSNNGKADPRKRITQNFSIERRTLGLLGAMRQLLGN